MNLVLPAILIGMGSWGMVSAVKSIRRWQTADPVSVDPQIGVSAARDDSYDNLATAVFDAGTVGAGPVEHTLSGEAWTAVSETSSVAIGHVLDAAAHVLHH
jgi:hypothetical protein